MQYHMWEEVAGKFSKGVHSNGVFVPVRSITLLKHMIAGTYETH